MASPLAESTAFAEHSDETASENIQVVVRCRPSDALADGELKAVELFPAANQIVVKEPVSATDKHKPKTLQFTFDSVFDESSLQVQ
mgnify:CR=1 FL=1